MAASRKSTPRRARSSSVASDTSVISTRSGAGAGKPASKGKTNTPKKDKAPATPRRSKAKASTEAEGSQDAVVTPKPASAKKPASAAKPKSASKPASAGKASAAATPKTPASPAKPRKSSASSLTPSQKKAVSARPALPKERNSVLPEAQPPVKLQIINREGSNIIIGRVKLPTTIQPRHGFLLRRFDTNAIAASAMYRLAFPHASQEAEAAEMEYIEKRYETGAANGGMKRVQKKPRGRPSKKAQEAAADGKEEIPFEEVLPAGSTGVRLQGTWIPCADALELAREYGLETYAVPLIEADAEQGADGAPILTPSKTDSVSTPGVGRASGAYDESPTKARTSKRARDEGSSADANTSVSQGLSPSSIAKQIAESQALAKGIQGATKLATPTASRKRRATHQSPSAHINALADEDDYEHSSTVVRSLRRGTRAARRRPLATTAGALGAAGAVGAGALAYISGGNLDVATQLLTQSFQSLSQWFFY